MSKQSGIVLPTTLMVLTLLALLVVSQMQNVFLYHKSLNQLVQKHQIFYQLEVEANKLAHLDTTLIPQICFTQQINPNEVVALLKRKQGCILISEKKTFIYLIENLGLFPCLQARFNKTTYSTRHLRITIMADDNKSPDFLQLRIAQLATLEACEDNELKRIKIGLLSWRYF